jgi:hypothetical protein
LCPQKNPALGRQRILISGLVWIDLLVGGNALGAAFGQPTKTTNSDGVTVCHVWFPPSCPCDTAKPDGNSQDPNDANYTFE